MDQLIGLGVTFYLLDEFSNTAQKIKNEFNQLAGLTDQLGARITKSINAMQLGLASIGLGIGLLLPFGAAVNKAREFEQQLSNIKSLGVLGSEMKQVEALALEMGAKTKFSATEAGRGIEELLKAGVKLKDIMNKDGLSGALDLAVAGELDLASAAEIASTALNAFRDDALTIRGAADILSGAANASATDVKTMRLSLQAVSAVASGVGLSFLDTSTALAVFANNGLKGSDAGTSLKTMLQNLQPRTKEQIATFQQLGLVTAQGANRFFDAQGKIKSMAEIAGLLNTQLKNLTPQQRAFTLETLFGSDAVRAANILYKEGAKGITDMQREMEKFKVAEVAKEKLNNFNGALEMLKGSVETNLIVIGTLFLPMLTKIVQALSWVSDAFYSLISTGFGKFLVFTIGAVGLLAVSFGTYLVVANLARFTSLQVAIALQGMGRTALATAFANNGLIGGLRMLAVQAYQTMIAFMPYIVIGALIGGAVYFAYKSFQSFQDVLSGTEKPAQGLLGFMQKLGGVIWGVIQVFKTWDGKTFNLGGFEEQLKSLGILDLVLNLSTWVVRLIELGKGIGTGFVTAFTHLYIVGSWVYQFLIDMTNQFFDAFGLSTWKIDKATSSIDDYIKVGEVLGYILGGVLIIALIALTVQMGIFAISVLAATWPLLVIIAIIGAVVAIFYYWDDIMAWFGKQWDSWTTYIGGLAMGLWQWISNGFNGLIEWFVGAPAKMYEVGVNFVNQLWEGIMSVWGDFTAWVEDSMSSLGLGNIFGGTAVPDLAGGSGGGNGAGNNGKISSPKNGGGLFSISDAVAKNKAIQSQNSQPVIFDKSVTKSEQPSFFIQIDGEDIANTVIRKQELNQARK